MTESYLKHFTSQNKSYMYYDYPEWLQNQGQQLSQYPYTIRILMEALLRASDQKPELQQNLATLVDWDHNHDHDVAFKAQRVLLQDFTGVPALVDLAAMRDKVMALGGDGRQINPDVPVHLIIDHSVQVLASGTPDAFAENIKKEFKNNQERYQFLKWAQQAFENLTVIPPDNGIIHQINLEYLAKVALTETNEGTALVFPDTVVGTDSHTTMTNGLGVLGWGVGGIEAEASMLGEFSYFPIPEVVGVRLSGTLPTGATATDLALTVTHALRQINVVGKFVEFFGPGLKDLTVADRATIANMAPEYGATCGYFPIDQQTLDYLKLTGRPVDQIQLIDDYAHLNGLWYDTTQDAQRHYTTTLPIDLSQIKPSVAGPKRPQDLVPLTDLAAKFTAEKTTLTVKTANHTYDLENGAIGLAAITSCTNTSNPALMLTAGLVAKKAVAAGLKVPEYVKTSLAPGSKAVTDYLKQAGLMPYLDQLGFNLVGYGCTTCIGNSGSLKPEVVQALANSDFSMSGVLSGNRNFEGRVNPLIKDTYLASPPLVVAFALAGTLAIDLTREALGYGTNGQPVYLKDLWPTQTDIAEAIQQNIDSALFKRSYQDILAGNAHWDSLDVAATPTFNWDKTSTYIACPTFLENMTAAKPEMTQEFTALKVLAKFGDSITTDHISPAGFIGQQSPAGQYLMAHHVQPQDFNSYGSRRGNHEVMVRGTLANIRIKNQLTPDKEGGYTIYWPTKTQMSIYDAAKAYQKDQTSGLVILAGKDYGMGSSRDWAAKGVKLLGVKAVIAESFERIHRSNLVMMGVLPLQFKLGDNAEKLGLDGSETFDIQLDSAQQTAHVTATKNDGQVINFDTILRFDTPSDVKYYENDGILSMIIRQKTNL
ncbi:aconitate hydratase AcnA [Agrilactobacillus yilanensis]|uniref:Aconitate hydratase n=1 Tax=Agrilactobacillus yilanensis TaxID=2485997 RepID=A0ABW4J7A4_9LACO|nr:aconitate hydratase AcnA [Agrilactobacillus yilanensis]